LRIHSGQWPPTAGATLAWNCWSIRTSPSFLLYHQTCHEDLCLLVRSQPPIYLCSHRDHLCPA
jgi:hypothetical protein